MMLISADAADQRTEGFSISSIPASLLLRGAPATARHHPTGARRTCAEGSRIGDSAMKDTTRLGWRQRAACLESDPEIFFPVGVTGPALEQIAQAKSICASCEVRTQCLDWALATHQNAGVWGGMTEDERREQRIHRRRARGQTDDPTR
jgi:WhiB family redox-sensing transcriptional regulator